MFYLGVPLSKTAKANAGNATDIIENAYDFMNVWETQRIFVVWFTIPHYGFEAGTWFHIVNNASLRVRQTLYMTKTFGGRASFLCRQVPSLLAVKLKGKAVDSR